MVNVTIAGMELRFTWNTLIRMAEASGKDAINPLAEIASVDHNWIIFYGAYNCYAEKFGLSGINMQFAIDAVKDFSGPQIGRLIKEYNNLVLFQGDEDVSKPVDEPEKPKKK